MADAGRGFACALCSYYLIERPAREWLNRNW